MYICSICVFVYMCMGGDGDTFQIFLGFSVFIEFSASSIYSIYLHLYVEFVYILG